MPRTSIKITRNLTAALVVAAAVAPAASSASPYLTPRGADDTSVAAQTSRPDPRSPDAKDAALAAELSNVVDLRSPDTKDAALASEKSAAARDAATSARWGAYQDAVTQNSGRAATVTPVASGTVDPPRQTDWDDEGIIAGGGVALMLAGLVGVLMANHRNRELHQRNRAALG